MLSRAISRPFPSCVSCVSTRARFRHISIRQAFRLRLLGQVPKPSFLSSPLAPPWGLQTSRYLQENDYRCKSLSNSKTMDPHQITNITDFIFPETIGPQKMRKLQIFHILIECKITVGCPSCTYPSLHYFVSKSRSVARRARVQAFVCVCNVCGVCVVCGGGVCVQCGVVSVCIVRGGVWCVVSCRVVSCLVLSCLVLSCLVLCWCVGVCGVCVARLGTRENTCGRFARYTRKSFERTHGGVWNLHTGGFSLSLLLSFLLSYVVLFLRSLPSFSQ